MKNFLILLALIITSNLMAANWAPLSKVQSNSIQAFELESDCLRISGEQCFDLGNEPGFVEHGFFTLEDVYAKADVESCIDANDCDSKFLALTCSDPSYTSIKNLNLMEVYCVKLTGKSLVKDDSGWASYKSAQAALSVQAASLAFAKKLRECGGEVMDLLLVRNSTKGLTSTQVKTMVATYAPVKGLLETGSLVSAKEEINAVVADGVLVTEGDKTALIAKINSCLGL